MLFALLPLVASSAGEADFRVLEVSRREVYAGKLGQRVEQTLTAERDGKRYEIRVNRAHTGIRGSVREFANGDTVKPDWGWTVREVR